MGQWEEPVWEGYTFNYVTLWKTVETGEKPAIARRREGGVNRGSTRDV